jgi:hypothetical protein
MYPDQLGLVLITLAVIALGVFVVVKLFVG